MTTYYIFRHGQTRNSKYHIPYHRNSRLVKILPETIPTVEKLGKYFKKIKSEANFCSEYLRCKQTAKIVSKISGLKFIRDKRLNEMSGESFKDFKTRVKNFVDEMENKNYEKVVICTHGAVIAALRKLLPGKKFKVIDIPHYPNTGTLMIIKGKDVQVIDFN